MKDTFAINILNEEASVSLAEYDHVRINLGPGEWIDIELRYGEVTIRGSKRLAIIPHVANEVAVKVLR